MEAKHTPGPWRYLEPSKYSEAPGVQRANSGGFLVHGNNRRNSIADARLIAAAPDLLAALQLLTDLGEHVPVFQLDDGKSSVKAVRLAGKFTAAMTQARAAIAKATLP